jgi:hypothetical protein
MGSFGNPILLMLIHSCHLSLNCAREQHELHLISHLFRYPVETYSLSFSLGALVVIEEEPQ